MGKTLQIETETTNYLRAIGFRNNNITDMQAQMRVFIFFFLENEMFIR